MAFGFFHAIDVQNKTGWSWASILALVAVVLTTPPLLYFIVRENTGARSFA